MSFAEELRNFRIENLMSQEKLAQYLGVSFGTVNRWESGKTLPSLKIMDRILNFCGEQGYDRQAIFIEWKKDKEEQESDK